MELIRIGDIKINRLFWSAVIAQRNVDMPFRLPSTPVQNQLVAIQGSSRSCHRPQSGRFGQRGRIAKVHAQIQRCFTGSGGLTRTICPSVGIANVGIQQNIAHTIVIRRVETLQIGFILILAFNDIIHAATTKAGLNPVQRAKLGQIGVDGRFVDLGIIEDNRTVARGSFCRHFGFCLNKIRITALIQAATQSLHFKRVIHARNSIFQGIGRIHNRFFSNLFAGQSDLHHIAAGIVHGIPSHVDIAIFRSGLDIGGGFHTIVNFDTVFQRHGQLFGRFIHGHRTVFIIKRTGGNRRNVVFQRRQIQHDIVDRIVTGQLQFDGFRILCIQLQMFNFTTIVGKDILPFDRGAGHHPLVRNAATDNHRAIGFDRGNRFQQALTQETESPGFVVYRRFGPVIGAQTTVKAFRPLERRGLVFQQPFVAFHHSGAIFVAVQHRHTLANIVHTAVFVTPPGAPAAVRDLSAHFLFQLHGVIHGFFKVIRPSASQIVATQNRIPWEGTHHQRAANKVTVIKDAAALMAPPEPGIVVQRAHIPIDIMAFHKGVHGAVQRGIQRLHLGRRPSDLTVFGIGAVRIGRIPAPRISQVAIRCQAVHSGKVIGNQVIIRQVIEAFGSLNNPLDTRQCGTIAAAISTFIFTITDIGDDLARNRFNLRLHIIGEVLSALLIIHCLPQRGIRNNVFRNSIQVAAMFFFHVQRLIVGAVHDVHGQIKPSITHKLLHHVGHIVREIAVVTMHRIGGVFDRFGPRTSRTANLVVSCAIVVSKALVPFGLNNRFPHHDHAVDVGILHFLVGQADRQRHILQFVVVVRFGSGVLLIK